ncbi:cytochrome P450 [Imleria badia]|nr:cytochrome P450 [Imleria badia]
MSNTWMLVSAAAGVVAWWVAKRLFISHPLDKIRGPARERWIQGIPCPFSLDEANTYPSLAGNRAQVWHPTEGVKFMQAITKEYGGVVRLNGILGARELLVSDPLALQSISTNTSVWHLPSEVLATNSVLLGEGLPGTTGEAHRKHRKELSPVFSKSHIHGLVPVFYSVARKLRDALQIVVHANPRDIDLLPWAARVALELVGQGGLGYSFDKFADDKPDEYALAVKNLLPQLFRNPVARALAPFFPLPVRRFLAYNIPSRKLQELVSIVRVMDERSKKLLSSRKATLLEETTETVGLGKDLVTLLLRSNMRGEAENAIPDSQLLGHINALVFGAVDTTTSAFSRLFYLLALNPDMQDRIREESRLTCEQSGTEELDFKVLTNMTYTDAFIREVLRLHAPVPALLRCAIKDTILSLKDPIIGRDGQVIHEVLVPAGTTVFASLLIPNTSTQIWGEDALEFKPDRWLSPFLDTVVNSSVPGVYSHLMTFWGGASSWGMYRHENFCDKWLTDWFRFQFALLEIKIVILLLLSSFRFSLADRKIAWRSSGLQFPSVEETGSLALPLKVETL